MPPSDTEGTSITEQTYLSLREAILTGDYSPGERLTSVRLAEDLGVSRTPVRAALARLKADGIVDTSDGRAAWVRPLTVSAVEHAYEIVEALEGVLVRRLAETADESQIGALAAAIETMEQAARINDKQLWVAGDEQFHELLREFAGNPLLDSMLERVSTVIDRVRFLSLNLHPEGALISAQEHRVVFEALRVGDASLARRLHEAHLTRVCEEIGGFLRESFPAFGALPTPARNT